MGRTDAKKNTYVNSDPISNLSGTTGTADGTVDDVGAAFSQTTLNNNFKELSTKINAILTALRDANIIEIP